MSRLTVPRMLVVGSVVTSATSFRVAAGYGELLLERTPPLARLALTAAFGGPDAGRAEATFRDDLLALARDSAEASWREVRRGIDDFDRLTRGDETMRGEAPHRPYRVKP
jgi:hypothetical protein